MTFVGELTPFGLVLQARQEQANVARIASECGVSRVTVWRWANGVSALPSEHLDKLAGLLDVPRERLEAE